jgi:hypothetical protein
MFSFAWRKWGKQAWKTDRNRLQQVNSFRPLIETLEDRLVLSTAVVTAANAATAVFSSQAQTVTLSASVTDPNHSGDIVNEGTVAFTVVDGGGSTVGSPVSGSVSNGQATAGFSLPGGEAAGHYTIDVSYSDSGGTFADGGDTSNTLTVNPANVTTKAQGGSVSFSTNQPISLQATVANSSNPGQVVGEGTVTFTLLDSSGKTVGSPVTGAVSNGTATASFTPPNNLAAGNYTVQVAYADALGNFTDTGDTPATLTLNFAATTPLALNLFSSVIGGGVSDPMGTREAALLQQAQALFIEAGAQSPTQANALVQNEVQLMEDMTMAYDLGVLNINDPALQARITSLTQAIDTNPLFSTNTGYALASTVGALEQSALTQPGMPPLIAALALQQANADNAQAGTNVAYNMGVALGGALVSSFLPLTSSEQASLLTAQQAGSNNTLAGSAVFGYQLGLSAGALAILSQTSPINLLTSLATTPTAGLSSSTL